jgi:hypothetical protein
MTSTGPRAGHLQPIFVAVSSSPRIGRLPPQRPRRICICSIAIRPTQEHGPQLLCSANTVWRQSADLPWTDGTGGVHLPCTRMHRRARTPHAQRCTRAEVLTFAPQRAIRQPGTRLQEVCPDSWLSTVRLVETYSRFAAALSPGHLHPPQLLQPPQSGVLALALGWWQERREGTNAVVHGFSGGVIHPSLCLCEGLSCAPHRNLGSNLVASACTCITAMVKLIQHRHTSTHDTTRGRKKEKLVRQRSERAGNPSEPTQRQHIADLFKAAASLLSVSVVPDGGAASFAVRTK